MHNSFGWKKLLKILGIIFTFCFLLVFLIHFGFSRFPAETKKTDANILTVEGFQPEPDLERVKDEFEHGGYDMLIITGLNFPRNYYEVSMNGYLIFYPKIKFTNTHADDFHIIEVYAFSELGGKNCAHFN